MYLQADTSAEQAAEGRDLQVCYLRYKMRFLCKDYTRSSNAPLQHCWKRSWRHNPMDANCRGLNLASPKLCITGAKVTRHCLETKAVTKVGSAVLFTRAFHGHAFNFPGSTTARHGCVCAIVLFLFFYNLGHIDQRWDICVNRSACKPFASFHVCFLL